MTQTLMYLTFFLLIITVFFVILTTISTNFTRYNLFKISFILTVIFGFLTLVSLLVYTLYYLIKGGLF